LEQRPTNYEKVDENKKNRKQKTPKDGKERKEKGKKKKKSRKNAWLAAKFEDTNKAPHPARYSKENVERNE
jgi:hypothetical protein